jgi:hypothetical protein
VRIESEVIRTYQLSTMSANNFDDKTTFCISFPVFNGNITAFNSCVFLPHWINHSAFKDRKECLGTGMSRCKTIIAQCENPNLIVDFTIEFFLRLVARSRGLVLILGEELVPDQSK